MPGNTWSPGVWNVQGRHRHAWLCTTIAYRYPSDPHPPQVALLIVWFATIHGPSHCQEAWEYDLVVGGLLGTFLLSFCLELWITREALQGVGGWLVGGKALQWREAAGAGREEARVVVETAAGHAWLGLPVTCIVMGLPTCGEREGVSYMS